MRVSKVWRTVYISKAVGKAGQNLLSIVEILGESQRNNARDGLTGLLLSHDGWFLQVLEGDRGRIAMLMARLARDPRHTDIQVLAEGEAPDRAFADWSMGQVLVTPEIQTDLAGQRIPDLDGRSATDLLDRAATRLRVALPA